MRSHRGSRTEPLNTLRGLAVAERQPAVSERLEDLVDRLAAEVAHGTGVVGQLMPGALSLPCRERGESRPPWGGAYVNVWRRGSSRGSFASRSHRLAARRRKRADGGWDTRRRRSGANRACVARTFQAARCAPRRPRWRRHGPRVAEGHRRRLPWRHPGLPADVGHQRARKEPARDVEVFATVGELLGDGVWVLHASRDNLLFHSPMGGGYGNARSHVPAGFSREVFFLTFGHPDAVVAGLYDDGGEPPSDPDAERLAILATFPARRSRAMWLKAGTYAVTFFITGSNFDAVTYMGHFKLGRSLFEREGSSMVRQTFRWTSSPARRPAGSVKRWRRRRDSTVPSPTLGDDWS